MTTENLDIFRSSKSAERGAGAKGARSTKLKAVTLRRMWRLLQAERLGTPPTRRRRPQELSLSDDDWVRAKAMAADGLSAGLDDPETHLAYVRSRIVGI